MITLSGTLTNRLTTPAANAARIAFRRRAIAHLPARWVRRGHAAALIEKLNARVTLSSHNQAEPFAATAIGKSERGIAFRCLAQIHSRRSELRATCLKFSFEAGPLLVVSGSRTALSVRHLIGCSFAIGNHQLHAAISLDDVDALHIDF